MRHTEPKNDMIASSIAALFMLLVLVVCIPSVEALGLGTFNKEVVYNADEVSSIKYLLITNEPESLLVSFDFEGSLADYAAFRLDNYWYSTRVDKLDVKLEQALDLTNVSSATLTFKTKYDIEYGWDFGYVQVSTNNGSTWSQLAGTGTTTFRDGGAYVGIPGAPAYTGSVASWTLETMDLTPYVGNNIILRFRYITDDYYAEHGWLIDDISIPEIGFFDDVQSARTGWSSADWIRNLLEIDGITNRTEVYIDFTIPANYTYNNSEEKVIVTEIAGVDGDFNAAQGSVARIITRLPTLVRVFPSPPTPPGGGGGGGAPAPPYFAKKLGRIVTYIIEKFEPHKEYKMRSMMAEAIVRSIRLVLNSGVDGATVRVNPLESRPDSIRQDLSDVYSYFEVSTVNLYDSKIGRAVLEVAVEKSWLAGKGAGPDDIVVTRYSNGRWSDLSTRRSGEDSEYYTYDADSPGFSVFAVRLRSPIEQEEVVAPVPTPKPDISQIKKITVVTGDEDAGDMLAKEKQKLREKVGVLEDVSIPVVEEPTSGWADIIIIAVLLIAVIFIIVYAVFRKSEKEFGMRRKHPDDKRKKRR